MNEIEEIKNRLNLVDVISEYVKLEKAGVNYRARCPFHDEKTPSFFVSPSRQIWRCFGCNEGGDMFEFVKKIEGVEFADALKILAGKAGVVLQRTKEYSKERTERQKLLEVSLQASKFFIAYLNKSSNGKKAKEYLLGRGFKEETIKEWKIGYAPDSWNSLSDFLVGRGFDRKDVVKAGLATESKDRLVDRFRRRIIFPFFNNQGEIIGFTGRIFGKEDNEAKYLNTPATLIYDKSRALFGIHKAKLEMRKKDECILVEGNVDCIMSHQAGVDNVVAVSGTALTKNHLYILSRYSNNLTFCFDMDSAGVKATERGIDMARDMDFDVKVITLDSGKDPADYILEKGEEAWQKVAKKPIMEFYFESVFKDKDLNSAQDKKLIAKELLPQIKKIRNNIEKAHWIELLSEKLSIQEDDVRKELGRVKEDKKEVQEQKKSNNRQEGFENTILSLILIDVGNIGMIKEELFEYFSDKAREILLTIKQNKELSPDETQKELEKKVDAQFLNSVLFDSERKKEILKENSVKIEEDLNSCLINLEKSIDNVKKQELTQRIKNEKDEEKRKKIEQEYLILIKKQYGQNSQEEKTN